MSVLARLPAPVRRVVDLARRYEPWLWWLHSAWALAFGIGVMWVGSHHFGFVRVAVLYVVLVWISSLFLPLVERSHLVRGPWGAWLLKGIHYLNRNFYQQVLFFVLPIYWASATPLSVNMLFVVLVGVSAVISTLDLVYDRHLATNRTLVAIFVALNLFACLAAALPILWRFPPSVSLRISAAAAAVAGASLLLRRRGRPRPAAWLAFAMGAAFLVWTVHFGERLVPPVPMRVLDVTFGDEVDRATFRMATVFGEVPAGWSGTLDAVTAISAPMGLTEGVRHRWFVDGGEVSASDLHEMAGGRPGGFRLWTALRLHDAKPGSRIVVEVETAGGQLVGRGSIGVSREVPAAPPPPADGVRRR